MDVIYPVRPGDDNAELQFSLRSLANLEHGRVWVVGDKPDWVTGVEFVKGNFEKVNGHANIYRNLLEVCRLPDVADDITVMNDDIFLTAPITTIPTWYRSTLCEHMRWPKIKTYRGWWWESLASTVIALQVLGIDNPISYELHTPFRAKKTLMVETLELFGHVTRHNPPQWRSLYGNLHGIGGTKGTDCKALRPGPLGSPFHSTDDSSFRYFAKTLELMFPDPSPYERPGVAARPLTTVRPRTNLAPRRARA